MNPLTHLAKPGFSTTGRAACGASLEESYATVVQSVTCDKCCAAEVKHQARLKRARDNRRVRTEVYRSLGLRRNRDGSWE